MRLRFQPPAEPSAAAATEKPQAYAMLPHARPGGIAGLLELLARSQWRDDIYRLADDLAFEIDDLLPIVEAASMLGFITVKEGDAEVTEGGRRFTEAGILRRKELFRMAALDGFCSSARSCARWNRRAITRCRKNFSVTCWKNISARRRPTGNWKPR